MLLQDRGSRWTVTGSGTTFASGTQSAVAGRIYFITDLGASSNSGSGTLTVLGGSTGNIVIYQNFVFGGTVPYEKTFSEALAGSTSGTVSISYNSASGTLTYVNMSGFFLNTP